MPNASSLWHVKLTEALGREQTAMLESGEVHIGIRHDQGDRRFESRVLPPDEILAACALSLELGHAGVIDIGRLASHPLLLLESGYSIRRLFDAACRLTDVEPNILLESRAPHLARASLKRARDSDHSLASANGSLQVESRSRHTPAQADSGTLCHSMGQKASNAALCRELFATLASICARSSRSRILPKAR